MEANDYHAWRDEGSLAVLHLGTSLDLSFKAYKTSLLQKEFNAGGFAEGADVFCDGVLVPAC